MVIRWTLVVSVLVIAGCGGERALSHGLYEGLKTRERVLHPHEASTSEELPEYSCYEAERKRVFCEPPDRPLRPVPSTPH